MGSALAASGGAAMNDGDLRHGVTSVPRAVGAVFAIAPLSSTLPDWVLRAGCRGIWRRWCE